MSTRLSGLSPSYRAAGFLLVVPFMMSSSPHGLPQARLQSESDCHCFHLSMSPHPSTSTHSLGGHSDCTQTRAGRSPEASLSEDAREGSWLLSPFSWAEGTPAMRTQVSSQRGGGHARPFIEDDQLHLIEPNQISHLPHYSG